MFFLAASVSNTQRRISESMYLLILLLQGISSGEFLTYQLWYQSSPEIISSLLLKSKLGNKRLSSYIFPPLTFVFTHYLFQYFSLATIHSDKSPSPIRVLCQQKYSLYIRQYGELCPWQNKSCEILTSSIPSSFYSDHILPV